MEEVIKGFIKGQIESYKRQPDGSSAKKGETFPECVVIEPAYEKLKEHKETFIDKIVKFFDDLVYLKAKENVKLRENKIVNPINVSLIKWRTGVPTKAGWYAISIKNQDLELRVDTGYWRNIAQDWITFDKFSKEKVIAWCPMSAIEPYKE